MHTTIRIENKECPHHHPRPAPIPDEEGTFTLTNYERANLQWLFALIGYSKDLTAASVYPFSIANTGDWVGQLYWKFGLDKDIDCVPNQTVEQTRERLEKELVKK